MEYRINLIRQKQAPSLPQARASFGNRILDAAAEKQMKLFEKKRKFLLKIGIDEHRIIDKVGIKRSFKIAKLGSQIDIATEIFNFALPFAAAAALLIPAIGAFFAYSKAVASGIQFTNEALDAAFIQAVAPVFKAMLLAFPIVGLASRALTIIGNYLDVFQHVFLESLASRFEGEIKPKMQALYREFSKVSLKELAGDIILAFIPLPFIDTFRRFRTIRYERMQLNMIREMEKLHNETIGQATSSSP